MRIGIRRPLAFAALVAVTPAPALAGGGINIEQIQNNRQIGGNVAVTVNPHIFTGGATSYTGPQIQNLGDVGNSPVTFKGSVGSPTTTVSPNFSGAGASTLRLEDVGSHNGGSATATGTGGDATGGSTGKIDLSNTSTTDSYAASKTGPVTATTKVGDVSAYSAADATAKAPVKVPSGWTSTCECQ